MILRGSFINISDICTSAVKTFHDRGALHITTCILVEILQELYVGSLRDRLLVANHWRLLSYVSTSTFFEYIFNSFDKTFTKLGNYLLQDMGLVIQCRIILSARQVRRHALILL